MKYCKNVEYFMECKFLIFYMKRIYVCIVLVFMLNILYAIDM